MSFLLGQNASWHVRTRYVFGESVCLVGGFQPNIEEYLSKWDFFFSNLCNVDDVTLQFNELI